MQGGSGRIGFEPAVEGRGDHDRIGTGRLRVGDVPTHPLRGVGHASDDDARPVSGSVDDGSDLSFALLVAQCQCFTGRPEAQDPGHPGLEDLCDPGGQCLDVLRPVGAEWRRGHGEDAAGRFRH